MVDPIVERAVNESNRLMNEAKDEAKRGAGALAVVLALDSLRIVIAAVGTTGK